MRKLIHPDYWMQLFLSLALLIFWVGQHLRWEVFLKRIVIKNTNFWGLKILRINFWRNKGSVTSFIITGMVSILILLMKSQCSECTFFLIGTNNIALFLRGREQKWYFCSGILRININFWRGLPQGKFSEEGTAKTPHQYRGDIRWPPTHWHRSIVTTITMGNK